MSLTPGILGCIYRASLWRIIAAEFDCKSNSQLRELQHVGEAKLVWDVDAAEITWCQVVQQVSNVDLLVRGVNVLVGIFEGTLCIYRVSYGVVGYYRKWRILTDGKRGRVSCFTPRGAEIKSGFGAMRKNQDKLTDHCRHIRILSAQWYISVSRVSRDVNHTST